ncbi:MAG: DUF2474 family protein [Rubrivivax sp.]
MKPVPRLYLVFGRGVRFDRLRRGLSKLSIVETPDHARLPRRSVERWAWLAVIWLASIAVLGVVGLLLRFVLKA